VGNEFDEYVDHYKDIINRGARITGESFEYFIGVRLDLLQARVSGAPARILDFGCGIGATEVLLRERFPGARLSAIDSSPKSIEAARAQAVPGAEYFVSESERLPFADGAFDLVYSNGTFHHIDHGAHAALFAELRRVLRPGGDLFVFENNPLNPVMVREMRRNPFDRDARMLFPWYLRRCVARAGLRVQATRFYAFYPKQLKVIRWSERFLQRVPLGAQYFVWGRAPG
jgi:SAM-dependent methyltransferase